LLIERNQ